MKDRMESSRSRKHESKVCLSTQLRVLEIELRLCIEELKLAKKMLSNAWHKYPDLIEDSPETDILC